MKKAVTDCAFNLYGSVCQAPKLSPPFPTSLLIFRRQIVLSGLP